MKSQRNETQMFSLILEFAKKENAIRAVLLNGSRADPNAPMDRFQDYDIVYIVNEVAAFVDNSNWLSPFGNILIHQEPDKMDKKWPANSRSYTYLVLFDDWNRIDFNFTTLEAFKARPYDSQTKILLDKDNAFSWLPEASNKDYLPKVPTQIAFENSCNEFLWVSTYVAKGAWRQELPYATSMLECIRKEVLKLLTWLAAIDTDFKANIGKQAKYLEKHLAPEYWALYVKTYCDGSLVSVWKALFNMVSLFEKAACRIAAHFDYPFDREQTLTVVSYLKAVQHDAEVPT